MVKENKFQAACLKFLRTEVGGFWFAVVVSTYVEEGLPDICGCHKGTFYMFETKVGKYDLSDAQEEKIRRIKLAGGVAMKIKSIDELRQVFNL